MIMLISTSSRNLKMEKKINRTVDELSLLLLLIQKKLKIAQIYHKPQSFQRARWLEWRIQWLQHIRLRVQWIVLVDITCKETPVKLRKQEFILSTVSTIKRSKKNLEIVNKSTCHMLQGPLAVTPWVGHNLILHNYNLFRLALSWITTDASSIQSVSYR